MKSKIIICLLVLIGNTLTASAQSLTEEQVVGVMNNAFALQKAKKYAEALEAFKVVGENTSLKHTPDERQVYFISQTMACLCLYMTEQYRECYELST